MSIECVREYFRQFDKQEDIIEPSCSSATVDLAAKALGVIPARIAKTLSFKLNESCILIVCAGDARIDNKKYKQTFSCKAKMLSADEVVQYTGHSIGGVCPFALDYDVIKVYLDVSLKRFDTVFPACGSSNSAIELSCEELFIFSKASGWVDVCKDWR